ncbi:MAG: sensor histidine kinase [Acholeplasmataceae bacterium]|nr:sensor histidine kinase [Acholeplasmataceae bacterium]
MFKKLSISQAVVVVLMGMVIAVLLVTGISQRVIFDNVTEDVIQSSSREINKQVIMNYENYINEVINTANYLTTQTIELSEDGRFDDLNSMYEQAAKLSEDMVSIILFNTAGDAMLSATEEVVVNDVLNFDWFTSAFNNPEIFHFSTPHQQVIFGSSILTEVITVTKKVQFYDQGVLQDGVLMIDLITVNLFELALKTNLGENGHILILNDQSEFVYASNPECTDETCESKIYVDNIILGGDSVKLADDYMYVNINTLKNTRWRIATFININNLYDAKQQATFFSTFVLVVSLIISLGLSIYLSQRISNPLNKLKNHMQAIEQGEQMSEIDISGQKEVVALTKTFNHMVVEIKQLMQNIVVEQKEKRKSEFQALQTQIHPHFLYNTLDSIVWLAENNMNKEVVEMVIALSRFFRISISRGKNVISVKDELEHAQHYLLIQKIRYNKKFDYKLDINPKVYDYTIVKLVLQPIIENAIYHGINSEYEQGMILIKAYPQKKNLIFEIENNGYGITPEKIVELTNQMKQEGQAQSVGLRNVYQRIKLYYGKEADIIVTSELDEMTNIKIIIPMRKEEIDEKNN